MEIDAEGDYMAHIYAMFLLAQFREPRAYPLLIQFASLEGDLLYSLCGDFITENLGRVLASVSGAAPDAMQSIENERADEWARDAALGGITTLVAELPSTTSPSCSKVNWSGGPRRSGIHWSLPAAMSIRRN